MNDRQRLLIPGFLIGRGEIRKIIPLLYQWLNFELKEGWHTWGKEPEPRAPHRWKTRAREKQNARLPVRKTGV